jgi:ribonuclease BN (tRNA processing enzyme)
MLIMPVLNTKYRTAGIPNNPRRAAFQDKFALPWAGACPKLVVGAGNVKIKYIGVGEAFDEFLPNTSIWVRAQEGGNRSSILLDCGFTVPSAFWRSCPDAHDLDAIWISHFHGDHFFGLPALLTRFMEMQRRKPMLLLGQNGIEEIIPRTVKLAYPSVLDRLGYEIRYLTVEFGEAMKAAGVVWQSAVSGHLRRNLAVRIEKGGKSLFYSGDGNSTDETLHLAQNATLVIHEAFRLDLETPGHANVIHCIEFARRAKARSLALVHIERNERRLRREEILRVVTAVEDVNVSVPEPGDEREI